MEDNPAVACPNSPDRETARPLTTFRGVEPTKAEPDIDRLARAYARSQNVTYREALSAIFRVPGVLDEYRRETDINSQ